MDVAFYHTHGVFEFIPGVALTRCYAESIGKTAWSIIISWGTLNFEISWEITDK